MDCLSVVAPPSQGIFQHCWRQFNRWTIRHLSDPIELMTEILPEWVKTVSQVIGYGHFYFLNTDLSKVCIHFTCSPETPSSVAKGLRNELCALFARYHLEVVNINIIVLTSVQAEQPYHAKMLGQPLENQYYQLFLTALNNMMWWETYLACGTPHEVTHYISRYLRTNLEEFFEVGAGNADSMDHWGHIFEPFLRIGWTKNDLLELALSLETHWQTPEKRLAIERLIKETAS